MAVSSMTRWVRPHLRFWLVDSIMCDNGRGHAASTRLSHTHLYSMDGWARFETTCALHYKLYTHLHTGRAATTFLVTCWVADSRTHLWFRELSRGRRTAGRRRCRHRERSRWVQRKTKQIWWLLLLRPPREWGHCFCDLSTGGLRLFILCAVNGTIQTY
jgi:hypothetical protein